MRRAIVVDTNIIIASALAPRGQANRALAVALRRYTLAITGATLRELAHKILQDKFEPLISRRERQVRLGLIRSHGKFFAPSADGPVFRDLADDKFLHLAVAADAIAVITGDRDLLVLGEHRGIPILSPSAFLRGERLARRGRGAERR